MPTRSGRMDDFMKLGKIAAGIIKMLCILCFLALTVSLLLMILSRNIPFINFDVMWTDEIGRYLLVYLVFLGSGLAMIEEKHKMCIRDSHDTAH